MQFTSRQIAATTRMCVLHHKCIEKQTQCSNQAPCSKFIVGSYAFYLHFVETHLDHFHADKQLGTTRPVNRGIDRI